MSGIEYWKKFWNLFGDAFANEPLSFNDDGIERLIVYTEPIEKIQSILRSINYATLTKRYYLVGQRGMGKTTLINYFIRQLLNNFHIDRILPISINTITEAKDSNLLRLKFLQSTIESLFEMIIIDLSRINYEDHSLIEKFTDLRKKYLNQKGIGGIDITTAEQLLYHLLSTLEKSRINSFIVFYDELDKIDDYNMVLDFLRKSQSLIENLTGKYGCTVLFAGIPEWMKLLSTDEYSGVRGEVISLNPWTPEDVQKLIELRLLYSIIGNYINPFTFEVIEKITAQAQGRPRKILEHAKAMLIWGANNKIRKFEIDTCDKLFWDNSAILRLYIEISSEKVLNTGLEKLRLIYDPDIDDPFLYEILTLIYRVKKYPLIRYSDIRKRYGIDIDEASHKRILSRLEAMNAIYKRTEANSSFYVINGEIGILFDYITENLNESLDYLPYVIKTRKPEIVQKIDFSLRNQIIKVLENKPTVEFSLKEIISEILSNPNALSKARLYYNSDDQIPSDSELKKKMSLGGRSVLNKLVRQGYVLRNQKNKINQYRWLPQYINIGEFSHLPVHDDVIRDLEAAGQNLNVGLYDPCVSTCRSAIENSLRKLYNNKMKKQCPRNVTIDMLNQQMFDNKVYDRGLNSLIKGFTVQTNPIVHREVTNIGEDTAKALFDMTQAIVREIFKLF
ncbi:MAG TPA: hypothetical protein VMW03_06455 [Candidatus Krumholzibacteriaceae bacterium]|nr:hypothetical protein [Candidatus Krumholzibacteriaceae bacterium]